ncbi:hypothetical protein ABID65_008520 [Bradyrhizobium sp. S3.9.2]
MVLCMHGGRKATESSFRGLSGSATDLRLSLRICKFESIAIKATKIIAEEMMVARQTFSA